MLYYLICNMFISLHKIMLHVIPIICAFRIIMNNYMPQLSDKTYFGILSTQKHLETYGLSMLSSYEQALYKVLPSNLLLYNLCICMLDIISIAPIYLLMRNFLRYSIKPKHRFNRSLITHSIILLSTQPIYYIIVPYQITHIQLVILTIYIILLIQQHIFLQMIFAVILLMLNFHAYFGCAITSSLIFLNWLLDEKQQKFYIRLILLIMVFTIFISLLSIPFVIHTYKIQNKVFEIKKYIFSLKNYRNPMLKSHPIELNYNTVGSALGLPVPHQKIILIIISMFFIYQGCQKEYNVSVNLKFLLKLQQINQIYFIISIDQFQLIYLQILSSIIIFYCKKLDLSSVFGIKQKKLKKLMKKQIKKQKKLVIQTQKQYPKYILNGDDLADFNDIYKDFENLQIMEQMPIVKQAQSKNSPKIAINEYELGAESGFIQQIINDVNTNKFTRQARESLKLHSQTLYSQCNNITLISAALSCYFNIFYNIQEQSIKNISQTLLIPWISFLYLIDSIFVEQIGQKYYILVYLSVYYVACLFNTIVQTIIMQIFKYCSILFIQIAILSLFIAVSFGQGSF